MVNKNYTKPVLEKQEEKLEVIEKPIEKKKIRKKTVVNVKVRIAPNGGMVKTLNEGTAVTVTEVVNGWAHLDDGLYVMDKFLK